MINVSSQVGDTMSHTDTFISDGNSETFKLFTFTIPVDVQIEELEITLENIDISGSSSPLFYIIQKDTNILLKDSNNNIQEKNYLESHISLVSGSYNLLNVSNLLRELKGGYSGQGTNYILLLYCLDILGTVEFSLILVDRAQSLSLSLSLSQNLNRTSA